MDVRTFNHVVAGPTHPDLQLLRDVGEKLKLNLNYLFGLSSIKQPAPDDFDPQDFLSIKFFETFDGFAVTPWDKAGNMVVPRNGFRHIIEKHETTSENIYAMRITESDCDMVSTGNPVGYFKVQDFVSKKTVYSIGINGKNYIRWVQQRLAEDKLNIATDTLMQNSVQMAPEDVEIFGIMFRVTKDT